MAQPEDRARENIDRMLTNASWVVRDQGDANISAHRGLAIRNFTLKTGHGEADYLLYVDGRAAGVIEANVRFYFCPFIRASSGWPKWKMGDRNEVYCPRKFTYRTQGIG
jgi:type I restriction enzyme, R subunit